MSAENDPRVADILRVVERLCDSLDQDGANLIMQSLDFHKLSKEETMSIFRAVLSVLGSQPLGAMHVEALDEEAVSADVQADMAAYDERRAARALEAN